MRSSLVPAATSATSFLKPQLGTCKLATAVALASLLAACGSDSSDSSPEPSPEVSVSVVNYFTGQPLAEANVKGVWHLADGSVVEGTAVSNAEGVALLDVSDVSGATRVVVTADATGFSVQSGAITEPDAAVLESVELALQTVNIASTVDAESGFVLENGDDDTAIVEIAPSTLVTADGALASGDVTAEVTFIDPSLDPELMPGTYAIGPTEEAGVLESFGAINVTFMNDSGDELNLAEGQNATIRIPAAANSSSLPAEIPLFYFDDALGYWVEEGSATLVTLDGNYYYEGTVAHFSTWNADQVMDSVSVSGCVVDVEGLPVANARIYSQGQDYVGQSTAYTDESGLFSLSVRRDSEVLLQAAAGDAYDSLDIATSDEDLTLENCLVVEPRPISISLTWGEDPRDLDTHFVGTSAVDFENNFHVSYMDTEALVGDDQIQLDVDDTTGFGPEVTTMSGFPFAGTYSYRVHRYSGEGDIQSSPARVVLNLDGDSHIYTPPAGEPDDCWSVFTITVDESGNTSLVEDDTWGDSYQCQLDEVDHVEDATPVRALSSTPTTPENPLREAVRSKYYAQ